VPVYFFLKLRRHNAKAPVQALRAALLGVAAICGIILGGISGMAIFKATSSEYAQYGAFAGLGHALVGAVLGLVLITLLVYRILLRLIAK
jgi:hypothetical protein